jgi:hypothetical protein
MMNQPGKIKAYLYVKSKEGYPFERYYILTRLSLSAYNLPAIKVSSKNLDFGICPPYETRAVTFSLANLLPIECSVMVFLIPSEHSSTFQIPNTQLTIAANQLSHLTMTTMPETTGKFESDLVLVCHGGQMIRMKLKVICGQSIKILESQINFGPTDIFFDKVNRHLNIQNNDQENRIPVTFSSTTNEIMINEGNLLILEPGEFHSVPISFLSNLSGSRVEKLTIYAPNSHPINIPVMANSGPPLKIPVHDDIYFSSAFAGQTSYIRLPISNLLSEQCTFTLCVPIGSPIKFDVLPYSYSNHDEGEFEPKPFQCDFNEGMKLVMPASSTVVVEVSFLCITSGFFKVPLKCIMSQPRKIDLSSHHLYCAVFDDFFLSTTLNSPVTLYQFYQKPFMHAITPVAMFDETASTIPKKTDSDIFQISPPLQTIFGSNNPHRPQESLQFFHLINLTSEAQRYRLVLTTHFKTDIPLEGEVPANSFLDIPIRFDPNLILHFESLQFSAFGCITVLDSDIRSPGIVSSQIIGCVGELLTFEVRDFKKGIKYPDIDALEVSNRHVFVRNKSPITLECNLNIDVDQEYNTGSSNPFSIETPKIRILPFELFCIKIGFKASPPGLFKSLLFLDYKDPAYSNHQGQSEGNEIRKIGPISLSCSVGLQDITVSPQFLDYGDCKIGDPASFDITLSKSQNLELENFILPLDQFSIKNPLIKWKEDSIDVPIDFIPIKHCVIQNLLAFNVNGKTHSIPVIATAGTIKFACDKVEPLMVGSESNLNQIAPSPVNIIDIGDIEICTEKLLNFSLSNEGTLGLQLAKMFTTDESLVQVLHVDKSFSGSLYDIANKAFGSANLDKDELDIDNSSYLAQGIVRSMGLSSRKSGKGSITTVNQYTKLLSTGPTLSEELDSMTKTDLLRMAPFQKFDMKLRIWSDSSVRFIINI